VVTCTHTNQTATSNIVTVVANAKSADPASATAAPSLVCKGANTTLTLNGGGGGTGEVINWYTSSCGGTLVGTGNNLVVSVDTLTTFYGRYEDGAPCNYNSACATVTVTTKPLPALSVNPPDAVCTGTTTSILTASGAASYTWLPTTNLTPVAGTSATETVQISALTIYTVTGTGSNGCTINTQVPVATVAVGGFITPVYSIICSGGTKTLTVNSAAGHNYQWQISTDNVTWNNISGATNLTYTTAGADGNSNKYYRLVARSNACWDVASTTGEVDVSVPNIAVTTSNITDNSITLNWGPTGTGNYTLSYSGTS
jgi:hypothetical protein